MCRKRAFFAIVVAVPIMLIIYHISPGKREKKLHVPKLKPTSLIDDNIPMLIACIYFKLL